MAICSFNVFSWQFSHSLFSHGCFLIQYIFFAVFLSHVSPQSLEFSNVQIHMLLTFLESISISKSLVRLGFWRWPFGVGLLALGLLRLDFRVWIVGAGLLALIFRRWVFLFGFEFFTLGCGVGLVAWGFWRAFDTNVWTINKIEFSICYILMLLKCLESICISSFGV